MTNTPEIFAHVAADARRLDPDHIRATIVATHDRLPGGTSSSETGVRAARMETCTDRSCPSHELGYDHSHPVPNDPTGDAAMKPSASEADLRDLDAAVGRFITAIDELARRSHSGPFPRDWRSAVLGAKRLVTDDMIPAVERIWGAKKTRQWVVTAGDALHEIEMIAGRHVARDPNDHERSWTSGLADEQCCRVCIKLGLRVAWQDGGAGGLCQGCYRLRKRAAQENNLDPDDVGDPPETLIEELRRIGSPGSVQDRNARSRWFADVGAQHRDRRYCA